MHEVINCASTQLATGVSGTNIYQAYMLSERLASLGIMEAQLRAPLKRFGPLQHYGIEGFKGALKWAPLRRETLVSRTTDIIFSSLNFFLNF